MKKSLFLGLIVLFSFSCKNNNKSVAEIKTPESQKEQSEIQQKIAKANGLNAFKDVEQLQFTFNVKVGDSIRSKRNWTWHPKSGEIRLTQGDISQIYKKDGELSEKEKEMDHKFINDSYWLFFPFQMVWSDAKISKESKTQAPISKREMNRIIVSYPQGGYTPGDSYEIYYDEEMMIREWVYNSADGKRKSPYTWEDYKEYKGIKIAQSHKSEDGNVEIFFTNIKVK
ncbi:hypothetical protein [Salegentibacter chungangensis]|uniref:Lipoprotein n=1 Tax=Salegentibacter chungangensis TaxID=1335724 RepID=A0ABW3NVH4_9FLAO